MKTQQSSTITARYAGLFNPDSRSSRMEDNGEKVMEKNGEEFMEHKQSLRKPAAVLHELKTQAQPSFLPYWL